MTITFLAGVMTGIGLVVLALGALALALRSGAWFRPPW